MSGNDDTCPRPHQSPLWQDLSNLSLVIPGLSLIPVKASFLGIDTLRTGDWTWENRAAKEGKVNVWP